MKKTVFFLIFFFFAALFSKEVYFYRNGVKISMTQQKSIFKNGEIKNSYIAKTGAKFFVSGNIFVKLGTKNRAVAERWCTKNSLKFVKQFKYIPDWYLVSASGDVFNKSIELVEKSLARQAEPSFYFPVSLRAAIPDDPYFVNQWHLRNVNGVTPDVSGNDNAHVAEAWELLIKTRNSMGYGVKLAIVDDGFDLNHEDLSGRFLPGHDFYDGDNNPMPGQNDAHGTCCAGVVGASTDNGTGVAGVCPDCGLIPIRMDMNGYSLDSIAIESFEWAADAGADIISNSWGPEDNAGTVDMTQPLKDLVSTLATTGRNGKGIIILFAAGNGDESIETDGFASNDYVFGIGATNAAGQRCSYSDYGQSLDFMTPSADISTDGYAYFDGIYTTDNTSGGYVPGELAGSQDGKYAFEFAGTSSACPLAAGIVGLVLAANPKLTKDEVYDIFKMTSDKVGDKSYDSNGFNEYYGYGRLNACEAVRKAFEMGGTDVSELLCSLDPVDMEVSDDGPIVPDDETTVDEDSEVDIDAIDENTESDNESVDEAADENVPDTENNDELIENDSDSANENDADFSEISDDNPKKIDVGCSCSFVNI